MRMMSASPCAEAPNRAKSSAGGPCVPSRTAGVEPLDRRTVLDRADEREPPGQAAPARRAVGAKAPDSEAETGIERGLARLGRVERVALDADDRLDDVAREHLVTTSTTTSPKNGLYWATKLRSPAARASSAPVVPSIVAIFTSVPGTRPAAVTAWAAPMPISSFWAKMNWMSLSWAWRTASMTDLASSVLQLAVCAPTLVRPGAVLTMASKPSLRSVTTDRPGTPSSTK